MEEKVGKHSSVPAFFVAMVSSHDNAVGRTDPVTGDSRRE